MAKYTEPATSSSDESSSDERFLADGVERIEKLKDFKSRRSIVRRLKRWTKRRDDVLALRRRAENVFDKFMTIAEKVQLVKKVAELDDYFYLREILGIIARSNCDATVESEVEYEFNTETLDNPTLRAVESFISDPDAFIDNKFFPRIEAYVKYLRSELNDWDGIEETPEENPLPTGQKKTLVVKVGAVEPLSVKKKTSKDANSSRNNARKMQKKKARDGGENKRSSFMSERRKKSKGGARPRTPQEYPPNVQEKPASLVQELDELPNNPSVNEENRERMRDDEDMNVRLTSTSKKKGKTMDGEDRRLEATKSMENGTTQDEDQDTRARSVPPPQEPDETSSNVVRPRKRKAVSHPQQQQEVTPAVSPRRSKRQRVPKRAYSPPPRVQALTASSRRRKQPPQKERKSEDIEVFPESVHESIRSGTANSRELVQTIVRHAIEYSDGRYDNDRLKLEEEHEERGKEVDDEFEEEMLAFEMKTLQGAFQQVFETLLETREVPRAFKEVEITNIVPRNTRSMIRQSGEWGSGRESELCQNAIDFAFERSPLPSDASARERGKRVRKSAIGAFRALLRWLISLPLADVEPVEAQYGTPYREERVKYQVPLLLPRKRKSWIAVRLRYRDESDAGERARMGLPLTRAAWEAMNKRFNENR